MTLIGYLAPTLFADGAIDDALPEEASRLGKALVVIDPEPGASDAMARVADALPRARLSSFHVDGVAPRKIDAGQVLAALDRAEATTIIAIGAGGAIGRARLAAAAAQRRGTTCSVIAIPVGLSDLGLGRHVRLRDGEAALCPRPHRVIADPTTLAHAPARRLAAAGMELLVHAVEAYASPSYNPPADALAVEAIRRLARWLPIVVENPGHAEARRETLAGALTAGLALEKAVGGVDSLAHPLEDALAESALPGELHTPVLAAFVGFNARAVGERYSALSPTLGLSGPSAGLDTQLTAFARNLGLPAALRETATDPGRFAGVAEQAANTPSALANPRLLTPVDCRHILEAAW
jgi:alcohol dehydrogenase class IV